MTSFMKVTDGELKLECEPMEEVTGGVPIRLMGRNATHEIDLRSLRDLHEKKSRALQEVGSIESHQLLQGFNMKRFVF